MTKNIIFLIKEGKKFNINGFEGWESDNHQSQLKVSYPISIVSMHFFDKNYITLADDACSQVRILGIEPESPKTNTEYLGLRLRELAKKEAMDLADMRKYDFVEITSEED